MDLKKMTPGGRRQRPPWPSYGAALGWECHVNHNAWEKINKYSKGTTPQHLFFAFKFKTHNHSPDCGLKWYYMLLHISSNIFLFCFFSCV